MAIPVSMPKLLGVGLPGLTGEVVLHGGVQIVTAALLLMSGRKKEMKPGKRKNGRGRAGSRRKS